MSASPGGNLGRDSLIDWLMGHWFLLTLFAVYTAILFRNVAAGSATSSDMHGYFVGGRNMGGVAIGFSYFATFASTNSYVGHAGQSYSYGLLWLTLAVLIVFFTWASWRFVASRLRRFVSEFDALTIPDFLAIRFPHPTGREYLRVVSGLVITLVIVVAYTALGGFVSVVRTDVVQGVMMLIGAVTISTSSPMQREG